MLKNYYVLFSNNLYPTSLKNLDRLFYHVKNSAV